MSKNYTLITGASSGMGALCAIQFSHYQNLIIASENIEELIRVKNECANPENIILWHCNFATEREYISSSLSELLKNNDIVVDRYLHFAGINKLIPLKMASTQLVDMIFNVNIFSIIEILKTLVKKVNQKALDKVVLISAFFCHHSIR